MHPLLSPRAIKKRLYALLREPLFWVISLWGNAFILCGAAVFHKLEGETNPGVQGFIDSLSWAVGIVTTVGTGNLHATTFYGKVLTMCMMMGGAIFLWSYMALFVRALVDPELRTIEREVSQIHDLERHRNDE